jgi:hypothetical protein
MFGIRNLRKPRELSQPNQLDMVGERGFEFLSFEAVILAKSLQVLIKLGACYSSQ